MRLSKQAWNITPKIREVDILLRKSGNLKDIFIESHPEVCFTALANGNPMQYYKKREEGINERIEILEKFDKNAKIFINSKFGSLSKKEADLDDIFDACVLAVSASFEIKYLPEEFEYDSEGLPMRMALPKIK